MKKIDLFFSVIIVVLIIGIGITTDKLYENRAKFLRLNHIISLKTHELNSFNLTDEESNVSRFVLGMNTKTPPSVANIISKSIVRNSKKSFIRHEIVVGLIGVETYPPFNVYSTSKAGAKGLGQILPSAHPEVDEERLYEIDYNIRESIRILMEYLKENDNDLRNALNQYWRGNEMSTSDITKYTVAVHEMIGKYLVFKQKIDLEKTLKSKEIEE